MNATPQEQSSIGLNAWVREQMQGPMKAWPLVKALTAKRVDARASQYPDAFRSTLVEVLRDQYAEFPTEHPAHDLIAQLAEPKTATCTAGHQLSLGLGPMYVHEKISETITLAKHWEAKGRSVVPIFWMATEDHDFDEVRHLDFQGERYSYSSFNQGGPVKDIPASDPLSAIGSLHEDFGFHHAVGDWIQVMRKAYGGGGSLVDAHRRLIHHWYDGILCLDASDPRLKVLAIPLFEQEIKEGKLHSTAEEASGPWTDRGEEPPVPFRRFPMFYLPDGKPSRQRFDVKGGKFQAGNETWTEAELVKELHKHPERFSPNALMRPIYQEYILPNIAYTGGGGECAYWLQLHPYLESSGMAYGVVRLRQSVTFWPDRAWRHWRQLKQPAKSLTTSVMRRREDWLKSYGAPKMDDVRLSQSIGAMIDEGYRHYFPQLQSSVDAWKKRIENEEKRMNERVRRLLASQEDTVWARWKSAHATVWPDGHFQERYWTTLDALWHVGDTFVENLAEKLDVEGPKWWWIHP